MEKIKELGKKYNVTLRFEERKSELGSDYAEVYMDVTSFVSKLPPYAVSVEIEVGDSVFYGKNFVAEDFELAAIEEDIKSLLAHKDAPTTYFSADAKHVLITLEGGYRIRFGNSEWGSVEFL